MGISQMSSLIVRGDQPLLGVPVGGGDQPDVEYFTDEQESDEASPTRRADIRRALQLAGAWADMAWDGVLDELDRIRHESEPTPPLDL
jgi:hypothetical protein